MATVQQNQGHPSHRPLTIVQAHVVVDENGGGLNYRLAPGDGPSERYVTGERKIEIPNSPNLYRIQFHLIDTHASRKLSFDPTMPICAHDGEGCPMSGGITTDQFRQENAQKKKLTIDNYNSAAGPVGFTLFFVDEKDGQRVPEFDPIVDNGGGGAPAFN